MKHFAVAGVAVTILASLATGAAHANPYNVSAAGFTCGFSTSDDPSGTIANPGTQVGETDAGPVLVAGLPGIDQGTTPPTVDISPLADNPASAQMICDIQIGGTGAFADPDASHVVSSRGTVVAYLPPTPISYQATATDAVWSCTTWRLYDAAGASVDLYADATTGEFSTDASTATCDLAVSQSEDPCEIEPPACDATDPADDSTARALGSGPCGPANDGEEFKPSILGIPVPFLQYRCVLKKNGEWGWRRVFWR